jgi:hypothetical protein
MLAGVLVTCTPEAPVTAPAQLVEVYASPAAQPWLPELYACAPSGTVLRVTDLPAEADIALRLGEPEFFTGAAYQVGTEQVLVVGNHQSPLQDLTAAEVRDLFAGLGDPALQIWVYSQGEDVQALFTRVVMGGRAVTTQARLATSPEHMSNAVVDAPEAVGILPGRWKTGDVRVLYTLPDVPVLALVRDEPQGSLRELLACIQK